MMPIGQGVNSSAEWSAESPYTVWNRKGKATKVMPCPTKDATEVSAAMENRLEANMSSGTSGAAARRWRQTKAQPAATAIDP